MKPATPSATSGEYTPAIAVVYGNKSDANRIPPITIRSPVIFELPMINSIVARSSESI